jgi:hypothetical protein
VEKHLAGDVKEWLGEIPGTIPVFSNAAYITCKKDTSLPVQGYRLYLRSDGAMVGYKDETGLYYSLVTLKVLKKNYLNHIPCLKIVDFPDLGVRGVMLDISRDKVPKLQTLLNIAVLLADLKYNHFEMYVEGFSFAYPSFRSLWEGKETPLTGEEIRALDVFCKDHFIDLVPNQNCFGHMAAWLATDTFKNLAECPKGYLLLGILKVKSTLDPYDPRSVELVTKMTNDLLPNFTSAYFNMDLDEPFELGMGKSKKIVKEKGVGQVYLDYALKMHDLATARNKKMMMYCDIAFRQKEILSKLPRDITLLDWGYEADYPFEKNCRLLDTAGNDFILLAGTSSWTTITGRTENMLGNIKKAAMNGKRYGAKGLLVADWGDMGHWQYLPVSYPGYVAGAAMGWNSKPRIRELLPDFLSTYIYGDQERKMGNFVLDMGRYNMFEEFAMANMTNTMLALQFGLRDRVMVQGIIGTLVNGLSGMMRDIAPEMVDSLLSRIANRGIFDYKGLMRFLDNQEDLLAQIKINSIDSQLIRDEYRNAIRLIRLGANLKQYIHSRNDLTVEQEKIWLSVMEVLTQTYLEENKRLWLVRNKPGGYERSTAVLVTLEKQIRHRRDLLQKSFLIRHLHRFLEKLASAGSVLYLKITA